MALWTMKSESKRLTFKALGKTADDIRHPHQDVWSLSGWSKVNKTIGLS